MLTIESFGSDQRLSVAIAIFFAEDALPIWERQCPEDMRPRAAIEAAKAWLRNPCQRTVNDAASAASATYNAGASAAAAAVDASAFAAAASAASAAGASAAASAAAYYHASAAASAAYNSAASAGIVYRKAYIHRKLVQLLPHILEYKIYTKTSFKDSEQVLNLLSKQNQERFLFNLNHLR